MKCLHCGSEKVTGALAVEDDDAYPAGNHKVGMQSGRKRAPNTASSRLQARVCLECGYTALIAEDLSALSD